MQPQYGTALADAGVGSQLPHHRNFRKNNSDALKQLFKLYVSFLDELNLLGKRTLAIDGSKFRAVNSSKNNYNQRKINKHQAMIDQKADKYLKQLDELDKEETDDSGPAYRKEEVEAALQRLTERKIKYDDLQQQLDNTGENKSAPRMPTAGLLL
jgi:hypothetical protein